MTSEHTNGKGKRKTPPTQTTRSGEIAEEIRTRRPKPRLAITPEAEEATHLADVPASEGKPVKLDWLWPDRIEWGSVVVIQGAKGAGKSTWLRAIAAAVTGGPSLPGCPKRKGKTGNVLWYAGEEPLWSRVQPGLKAAGAVLSRCYLADALGELDTMLQLPNDCPRLEARIRAREARLVVIDPIFAFTDGTCDLEGPTVPARRFMREIMRVASATGCIVALSRNLRKGTSDSALDAGRGSGEIGNSARSVIHLMPLPDSPATYALSVAACNNGAPVPATTYRLAGTRSASVIEVIGTSELTADELTSGDDGTVERSQIEVAKALIRQLVPSGKVDAKLVKSKAEDAMIGIRTLHRAAHALGIRVKREGTRDQTISYWTPPPGGWK